MNAPLLSHSAFFGLVLYSATVFATSGGDFNASALDAARAALASDRHAKHSVIELLGRQLSHTDPNVTLLRELGLLLASTNEWDRAREITSKLEKLTPRPDAAIHEIFAAIAEGQGDLKEQISRFRALLKLTPDHAQIQAKLAWLLLETGEIEEALDLASRAAELLSNDASLLVLKTRALIGLSRWTEASECIAKANQTDPKNSAVKALFPSFERLGVEGVKKLERLSKKRAVGRIGPEECYEAGSLLLQTGFHGQALPFFEAATKISPEAMLPRLLFGRALVFAGQIEQAGAMGFITTEPKDLNPDQIAIFRASDAKLLVNPGDITARYDRAWYLNEIGQYLLALEETNKITEDEPNHAGAMKEAAFALFKLARFKQAEEQLLKAIQLDSSRADAFALLGKIRLELANLDGAADALKKSLAIQSSDEVRKSLDRIQKIMASRQAL